MKICFLLSTFTYDGIKRSVAHFANTLHEMGHEVWIGVLHEWPGKLSLRSELRIPAERIVSWDGLGQLRREWAIYRFFRRRKFDVVHANTVKMNHVGRWMALAAGVPCIVASEDNLCLNRSWKTKAEDRLLARLGGAVVMISEAVKESFLKEECLPPEKVRTIYYGIPAAEIRSRRLTAGQLESKRHEWELDSGPVVVCAARLDPSKSLETLIEAAALVTQTLPSCQFLIAGDGGDRQRLEGICDNLKMREKVRFLGARQDIYDIFQLADAVTLCSLWEGLGFSLMEAMALEKPLVGTNVTGINEIIVHNRNGLLIPARSPKALAEALLNVLRDPPLAHRFGAEGPRVLDERFDIRRNSEKLLELYREILARRGSPVPEFSGSGVGKS
ncbi:MAG: glycosyltransferase family 4 protein [Verrucomicrobiae bacterium]|nr:glycosyltransferase family 4 protein [Verrucomicrobiae bacterium]